MADRSTAVRCAAVLWTRGHLTKSVWIVLAAATAALGQTGTASIQGTVLDAGSLKPVPAALVTAVFAGLPAFAKHTKSGGDGAFQIGGLKAGSYSICVQAAGDQYIDPCQWSGIPTTVTLASGQNAAGISVQLAKALVVSVNVQDTHKLLSELTKDGRLPDLTVGVWGPNGLYYPAHVYGRAAGPQAGATNYGFRLAVPRDTPLRLFLASHDLKLGDATGQPLTGNSAQLPFQPAVGDASPQSYSFSVLAALP